MSERPEELRQGPFWLRQRLKQLVDWAWSRRPVSGTSTTVDESEDGRVINVTYGAVTATLIVCLKSKMLDGSDVFAIYRAHFADGVLKSVTPFS